MDPLNSSIDQLNTAPTSILIEEFVRRDTATRVLDLWLSIFVVLALIVFALLFLWKPTTLQYTSPDKLPTGKVNTLSAMVAAVLLAALVASVAVAMHVFGSV